MQDYRILYQFCCYFSAKLVPFTHHGVVFVRNICVLRALTNSKLMNIMPHDEQNLLCCHFTIVKNSSFPHTFLSCYISFRSRVCCISNTIHIDFHPDICSFARHKIDIEQQKALNLIRLENPINQHNYSDPIKTTDLYIQVFQFPGRLYIKHTLDAHSGIRNCVLFCHLCTHQYELT